MDVRRLRALTKNGPRDVHDDLLACAAALLPVLSSSERERITEQAHQVLDVNPTHRRLLRAQVCYAVMQRLAADRAQHETLRAAMTRQLGVLAQRAPRDAVSRAEDGQGEAILRVMCGAHARGWSWPTAPVDYVALLVALMIMLSGAESQAAAAGS